jgi:flavin-dependent dehydrogenase
MTAHRAEILVAGAGPAGATIARLLALRGRNVILVDPQTRITDRLELLAPAALGVLGALDLAPLIEDPSVAKPCLGIRRRWGHSETQIEDFLRQPGGRGYILDRAVFDARLKLAAERAGAEFLRGRVVGVDGARSGAEVLIQTSERRVAFAAGLVVDATGRPSAIARRLGARRIQLDYRVSILEHRDMASDRNSANGWLDVEGIGASWSYALCGPDGRREKWVVKPPDAPSKRNRARKVDASSGQLSCAGGENWVAIGDAAATFDPITSQGLFNALSTALVAAGAILVPSGFSAETAMMYSEAIMATFENSEKGREEVYRGLHPVSLRMPRFSSVFR